MSPIGNKAAFCCCALTCPVLERSGHAPPLRPNWLRRLDCCVIQRRKCNDTVRSRRLLVISRFTAAFACPNPLRPALFRRALAAGSRNGCKKTIETLAGNPGVTFRSSDTCRRTNVRHGFRPSHHGECETELLRWAY